LLPGAGLVDEHYASIEIALLPREALVNLIGDDVRDPPPILGLGEILLTGQLLAGGDIPKAEFGLQAPVCLAGHATR
jgi:hypothetical protein